MKCLLRVFILSIICVGLIFSQTAIAVEKAKAKVAVATVNGADITEDEFNMAMNFFQQRIAMQGQKLEDDQLNEIKKKILDNMIDTELLYQAAGKEKAKIDEEQLKTQWSRVEERMKTDAAYKENIDKMNLSADEMKNQIRRQMLIQQFVTDKFVNTTTVPDEEIKAYYESNGEMFHTPEQIKASHILIKVEKDADEKAKAEAKKQIKDVQKQLKGGADFAELAKKYSQCPSKTNGGDLGFFGRGKMVKPFEEAAFAMKEGDVSDIVTTDFGYHIIKVTGKKDASTIPLDQASEKLASFLKQQKVQQKVSSFLQAEKEKSKITLKDK